MSYIDEVVQPGERVRYRCRPHWIIFAPTLFWFIAMIVIRITLPNTHMGDFSMFGSPKFYVIISYLTLILGVITAGMAYILYISCEYCITDRRVIMKMGLIRRDSLELYLRKIESILIIQSIPGRFFDYGTIIISGTGGSKDSFFNIPHPLTFRQFTQDEIYDSEHEHAKDE
jgi:uncharacterized membrane protein YdbT with pleckstrin-like domain